MVALDLETVGLDLAEVPLDDILDFREHHGQAYRAYARDVRRQFKELGRWSRRNGKSRWLIAAKN
jgi:hypothetical protein